MALGLSSADVLSRCGCNSMLEAEDAKAEHKRKSFPSVHTIPAPHIPLSTLSVLLCVFLSLELNSQTAPPFPAEPVSVSEEHL